MVACGGDTGSGKEQTQVAAKVNGEEITVHELNQILSRVRIKVTEENQAEIKQNGLESLIDQRLILQAAKNAKLDRGPDVLTALEEAKRKVLVDAYMQKTLKGVGKPSAKEVEEFYSARPEIFTDRKQFFYTQLTVPEDPEKIDSLIEKVKSFDAIGDLLANFDNGGVEYKKILEVKESEKIPGPLLAPLNILKEGDIGFLKMSDGLLIIALERVSKDPVTLEQARGAIERELYSQKQQEAAKNLIESLKEAAQIEYLGEFLAEQDDK